MGAGVATGEVDFLAAADALLSVAVVVGGQRSLAEVAGDARPLVTAVRVG